MWYIRSVQKCPIVFQGHPANFAVTRAEKLTIWIQFEITMLVAAIKSLRFALLIINLFHVFAYAIYNSTPVISCANLAFTASLWNENMANFPQNLICIMSKILMWNRPLPESAKSVGPCSLIHYDPFYRGSRGSFIYQTSARQSPSLQLAISYLPKPTGLSI